MVAPNLRQRRRTILSLLWLLWLLGLLACGDVDVPDRPVPPDDEGVSASQGAIRGTIAPEGIGATALVFQDGQIVQSVQANDQGGLIVTDLEPGNYDLEVFAPRYFVDTSLRNLEVFAGLWTDAAPVTLRPWSDAAILTGIVLDSGTQQPVHEAGILVECTTNVCSPISASTQADGAFEIQLWPDLTSTVTVRKSGYETEQVRIQALGVKGNQRLEVALTPRQ